LNRRRNSGRKRKGEFDVSVDAKPVKSARGAASHAEYQRLCKIEATTFSTLMCNSEISLGRAAKDMKDALLDKGVDIHTSSCKRQIKQALKNNCIGLSPQKPGGVYISSKIEREVAKLVEVLRERQFPVFPEDVVQWTAKLIEGTEYATMFPPDGIPTRGWYRGWLSRMDWSHGKMKPLELTRAKWMTEANLNTYFVTARDLLVNAGVAEMNPDFDPTVPYSHEIIITKPECICSYDETRMELDCTKAGGKDKTITTGKADKATIIVTKSSKSASAVCGRLGDGRSLPVFICYASGDFFDPEWRPHIVFEDVFDSNGAPLAWRYISNVKGSITEEYCSLYLKDIIYPALGCPKPRATHPGQQGVVICDGVGTHIGINVVMKAVELGLEILLRVPHLSNILQGEDTLNFKELKFHWRKNKYRKFTELNPLTSTTRVQYNSLGYGHFMACFKPAWDIAFTKKLNIDGWRVEGTIPFNRYQLWKARGAPPPDSVDLQDYTWTSTSASSLTSGAAQQSSAAPRNDVNLSSHHILNVAESSAPLVEPPPISLMAPSIPNIQDAFNIIAE